MRGLRRIARTAGAVAAVLVGSISLGAAQNTTTECTNSAVAVTFPDSQNEVKFKCAADHVLAPSDLTKVYATVSAKKSSQNAETAKTVVDQADQNGSTNSGTGLPDEEPVALTSIVPYAKLTVSSDEYTLAVSHSTKVATDQELSYYCTKDSSSACKITVTVKARDITPAVTCNTKGEEAIFMSREEPAVKFACGADYQFYPDLTHTLVKDKMVPLEDLYETASLTGRVKAVGETIPETTYTLSIPERKSSKILNYQCKKDTELCSIQITVEANQGGPSEDELKAVTCTKGGKLDLTLNEESPGVVFACALDIPTLQPDKAGHACDNQDCTSTVELNTLYKKAGLYTDSSVAAYVYFLYIPYREEEKVLSYQCKNKQKTNACTVNVTVKPNKDVIPVCRNEKGAQLSYEDFSESVKFKCDETYPMLVPSDLAKVYTTDPSTGSTAEAVELTKVYGGAKLVSDGDKTSPTFTLTIPTHLPRDVKKIYYQCKKKDNTVCTVGIRVAAKETQMRTCTKGADQKMTITGPGEIVKFKCGDNMKISPTYLDEVYDNADAKCSTAANITDLIPHAEVTPDTTNGGKQITFTELPKKEQALCYSCSDQESQAPSVSFRAPQTANQCKIMIEVKSAAFGLSAQTLVGHALILVSLAGAVLSAL